MRNSPIYCFIAGLQASEKYRLDGSLLSYNYDFFLKTIANSVREM